MRFPLRLPRTFLPLLVKELTEQSARRRTYVLRVLYATLLYGLFAMFVNDRMRYLSPTQMLGQGGTILELLLGLEYAGIYLLLPAMMAGVVAAEKERDTFVLLLITDLPPWEILLQKWLGRVVPMACFILLGLPLMGVAYAYGGISPSQLWIGVAGLACAVLQVSAVGLMWSCYCRSTAGAFVATYLTLLALYFGPMVVCGFLYMLGFPGFVGRPPRDELLFLLPPYAFQRYNSTTINLLSNASTIVWSSASGFYWTLANAPAVLQQHHYGLSGFLALPSILATSIKALSPILGLLWLLWIPGSALVFFVLARLFVVRRAMVQPRNVLLAFFRYLDRRMHQANRLTGGIVLLKSADRLPDDRPVAWRELTKRALSKPHYLLRVLLVIELPVIVLASFTLALGGANNGPAIILNFLIWALVALLVVVQAASAMASERGHQTLDVLLSTPLTGRRIVLEKTAGLRRLIIVMMIPMLSMLVLQVWWRGTGNQYFRNGDFTSGATSYGVMSFLAIAVYLPLLAWFGLWVGMWSRNPSRAILLALSVFVGWCLLPELVTMCFPRSWGNAAGELVCNAFTFITGSATYQTQANMYREPRLIFFFLSPGSVIFDIETNELRPIDAFAIMAVYIAHFAACAGLLVLFRTLALRRADRYLGRVPDPVSYGPEDDRPGEPIAPIRGSVQP